MSSGFRDRLWGRNVIWSINSMGLPRWLVVKNHLPIQMSVRAPGWWDPLEKEMATHSSILAWKVPQTEQPGGLQSMRSQKSRTWQPLNNNTISKTLALSWKKLRHHKKVRSVLCFPFFTMWDWNELITTPTFLHSFSHLHTQNFRKQTYSSFAE